VDYKALAEAALEERAKLVTELRSVNDDKTLTDADKERRGAELNAEIAAKTAEARAAVEDGEREAESRDLFDRAGKLVNPAGGGQEKRSELDEFRNELRSVQDRNGGDLDLTVPAFDTRAAGTNTAKLTDSAWAGTTVQSKFVAEVLQSLTEFSPILQSGARIVVTSSGEKMEWPLKNGRIVAAAVAEGATYTKSKGSFTRFTLDAFKYGIIAEATYEMLKDTQLPLESIIAQDLGESLAIKTAVDFLKGDGTTGPQGLVTATTLNTALANRAAITTDALVTFQHSITPSYRRNAKWYVSDDFVLAARLLKDGQGRYVWQDGIQLGAPDTLLGKQVVTDVNMDVATGAGKIPALFGDFSKFIIRFVGGATVSRSDEYGWDSDIVAWKANVRVDSGQSDAASVAKITLTA
jgi:HK97 family phage major capsid protein